MSQTKTIAACSCHPGQCRSQEAPASLAHAIRLSCSILATAAIGNYSDPGDARDTIAPAREALEDIALRLGLPDEIEQYPREPSDPVRGSVMRAMKCIEFACYGVDLGLSQRLIRSPMVEAETAIKVAREFMDPEGDPEDIDRLESVMDAPLPVDRHGMPLVRNDIS